MQTYTKTYHGVKKWDTPRYIVDSLSVEDIFPGIEDGCNIIGDIDTITIIGDLTDSRSVIAIYQNLSMKIWGFYKTERSIIFRHDSEDGHTEIVKIVFDSTENGIHKYKIVLNKKDKVYVQNAYIV